jgi:Tol biopolymer transport system component
VAIDTNGTEDVFVADFTVFPGISGLQLQSISLISANHFGTDSGNGRSENPAFRADGYAVAFNSYAGDLTETPDTNGASDIFVRDRETRTTTLLSINREGTGAGNSASGSFSLSADGRIIVFESEASDLVTNDTNGRADVFVRPVP